MSIEKIARRGRRRPLFLPGETTQTVQLERDAIEMMLPHRDPFLLLDSITHVDLTEKGLIGKRHIFPEDPVFQGHFPDYPVYPGTLMMEMIGQASLCLHFLLTKGRVHVTSEDRPLNLRLLKLHHALFQAEVRPDDHVTVASQFIEDDSYTVTCAGQILKGEQVCALAIMEVYLLEDE